MGWHDPVLKALEGIERALGGNVQYALGKRFLRDERLQDALAAFTLAERLLAESKSPNEQHVIAAIIRQAYCSSLLGNHDSACAGYGRALARMTATGEAHHPVAHAIARYLVEAGCAPADIAEVSKV